MTSETSFIPLVGGCPCGAVRFRMEREPIDTHCCHCRDCQRSSGTAFRINSMIEADQLAIVQGAVERVTDALGGESTGCSACKSVLWSYHRMMGPSIAFVGVGLMDEGERLVPGTHFFVRSKHPWITLPEGVPAFEQLGDSGKPGVGERIRAAMAKSEAADGP